MQEVNLIIRIKLILNSMYLVSALRIYASTYVCIQLTAMVCMNDINSIY